MTSCIPPAFGVPGLSGPPQWWDTGANPPRPHDDEIDDPRWRGASRHAYNSGAGEEGVFRALHAIENGKPVLYLSWRVLHDPTPGLNTDEIYVGFQRSAGPRYVAHVVAYDSAAQSFKAEDTAGNTIASISNTGVPSNLPTQPAWLNDTRAWLTLPSGGGTSYEWAIAMRVPITDAGPDVDNNGINLGNLNGGASFNFWYAIVKDEDDFVAAYYWPRTGAKITIDNNGNNVFPTAGWDDAHLDAGAGCGLGIALESSSVGTTNNDPSTGLPAPNLILVSAASATANHLYAKPMNSGAVVGAGTLSASFRTANWGSQADFTFAVGSTPWEEILPGTPKTNAAAIPTSGSGEIAFDWTISTSEAADWLPGGSKWSHQCLLVTLSGPYDFINDSVYRNMDFRKASEFEQLAQISVEGLSRLPAPRRTVYLYVERNNMPRELEEQSPPDEPQSPPDVRRTAALLSGEHETVAVDTAISGESTRGPLTIDEAATRSPTVRFHVYHETGGFINVNGVVKPVVEEQTAFGHFVGHEGEVYGWDVVLGGAFKKIADNVFRLEVPEDSRTVINTRVRAWEAPPSGERPEIEPAPKPPKDDRCPPHRAGGCLKLAMTAAGALVALIKRLLKKKH